MASAMRKERSNKATGSFPSFPLESRCLHEADAPKPCPKGTRSPEASSPEVGAVETSDPVTGIFLFFPSCPAILSLPFSAKLCPFIL